MTTPSGRSPNRGSRLTALLGVAPTEALPRARYVVPLGDLTQEERTPAQVHRLDALAETIGRPVLERLEDDPQTAPVIEAWLRNSDREQQVLNLTRTIVEELKVPRLRWRILNALRKLG